MELAKLIDIDKEKCVNCHRCISVCPTKYPNNGVEDIVKINDDLCIGCGECIHACSHGARIPIDDFQKALTALKNNENVIAICAPAVASNFPQKYLNLNGWLKELGVKAFFDVSFGAELTVKTYIEHVKKNNPKAIIAQPCPAIVNYIQIYQPELIPYLAPADSPMLHAMKMIQKHYPQYKNHKMMILSPCIAKRREFDETGIGDFNVTMRSIWNHLEDNNIDLANYKEVDYDNDPAERAVVFSSPGGLLETAEREIPSIRSRTRKIEGPEIIYGYLKQLPQMIKEGKNPLLIDCLNCELGCNGGTGTTNFEKSPDELEFYIKERSAEMKSKYETQDNDGENVEILRNVINKYWAEDLYERKYRNLNNIYTESISIPTEEELDEIYKSMHKYSESDIKNCSSCGYNSCELMAIAIHNKTNRKENCHFYVNSENNILHKELEDKIHEQEKNRELLKQQKKQIIQKSEDFLDILNKFKELTDK